MSKKTQREREREREAPDKLRNEGPESWTRLIKSIFFFVFFSDVSVTKRDRERVVDNLGIMCACVYALSVSDYMAKILDISYALRYNCWSTISSAGIGVHFYAHTEWQLDFDISVKIGDLLLASSYILCL